VDSETKDFLERFEARILERLADLKRLPSVLKRKDAARELSMSLSLLKQKIRAGEISTCAGDPGRIPSSEIQRYARAAEPARRAQGRGRPSSYDAHEEAEKVRERIRARRKGR